ncbi:hypothetical protein TEA_023909 [Camellia sinensis var. sinensis]|uniref:Uncharacterized protein n=1 Tax=Camellia sinensis var. sinensis TaxID=542762 RepID=A0A4S4EBH0_CAMSN|nr:hypothetical protein TEA_023909 [Camellia sinensis var. sinensis]
MALPLAVLWSTWKHRNECLFKAIQPNLEELCDQVKLCIRNGGGVCFDAIGSILWVTLFLVMLVCFGLLLVVYYVGDLSMIAAGVVSQACFDLVCSAVDMCLDSSIIGKVLKSNCGRRNGGGDAIAVAGCKGRNIMVTPFASSVDARTDQREYWQVIMKDQPMPEAIEGLISHQGLVSSPLSDKKIDCHTTTEVVANNNQLVNDSAEKKAFVKGFEPRLSHDNEVNLKGKSFVSTYEH